VTFFNIAFYGDIDATYIIDHRGGIPVPRRSSCRASQIDVDDSSCIMAGASKGVMEFKNPKNLAF
jgi:hypothetical protein